MWTARPPQKGRRSARGWPGCGSRTSLPGPCARLAPLKCTVKSTAQFLLEAPGGHLVRLVTAGNRTWVESRPGGGRRGRGRPRRGRRPSRIFCIKGAAGRTLPLPGAELALASGSLFSAHPLLRLRETPHVPHARAGPGGPRGCLCETSGGPGPGPCPRRLRGLGEECASGSMVSAEAAAVERPARFDVRGGALKLAGRLFRGALRARAEGKRRARRPALRGVWPGGPGRGEPESPPQRGVAGWRGAGRGDFSKWRRGRRRRRAARPRGSSRRWCGWVGVCVCTRVLLEGGMKGWRRPPLALPTPPSPPPTSLPASLPLPTAGPRLGARSAGGGSVSALDRPEPKALESPAFLLAAPFAERPRLRVSPFLD